MIKKLENHKVEELTKLNLIPIMDAVFIFIFFLLFSAQFLKIYEIDVDAPVLSSTPITEEERKNKLDLKLTITSEKFIFTSRGSSNPIATFDKENLDINKVKTFLINLRVKHPDDGYVILSPQKDVSYKDIIIASDLVKVLPEGMTGLILKRKNKEIKTTTIFKQIIMEPI